MGLTEVVDVLKVVGLVGKSGESAAVEPGSQLVVVGAKAVDAQVKLFAAEQQGPADVLLN